MKTAIYVRISRDTSHEGLGVARQEADCRALCVAKGWEGVELYADNDKSAYSRKPRPEYSRLLDELKNGLVSRVVVWHPDRLHRSLAELEDFIDVIEGAGADVATVTAGDYDIATPDGRLIARILASVARKESEDKSRRIRRKHLELAQAGAITGNGSFARGYGYQRMDTEHGSRLVIVEEEAEVIREAAQRYLAGESFTSIVKDFNRRNIPPQRGDQWFAVTLRNIVRSGRVSGQREHKGEIVAPAQWDPIISPDVTAQIRARLSVRAPKRTPRTHLLSGLIYCGRCGGHLTSTTNTARVGKPRRQYRCAKMPGRVNCGRIVIQAPALEDLVTEIVLQAIDGPQLAEIISGRATNTTSPRLAALTTIGECEALLENLAVMYAAGELSKREWEAARARANVRIVEARSVVDNTDLVPVIPLVGHDGEARREWPMMPISRRSAIVSALITEVTIQPGTPGRKPFDPTRVNLAWRV